MNRFSLLRAAVLTAMLLGLPLAAGPALAHAALVTALPAPDSAVGAPAPTELRLSFSEAIELSFTKVTVTGPDGTVVPESAPALDPADPLILVVPLTAPLPAGRVKIEWTAVAADGHKSKGGYTLVVAP